MFIQIGFFLSLQIKYYNLFQKTEKKQGAIYEGSCEAPLIFLKITPGIASKEPTLAVTSE